MKKILFILFLFPFLGFGQTFTNPVLFNSNVVFKGKTIASNDSIRFTNSGDTMTIGVRNNHGYITCYTCDSIQIYPPIIGSGGGGGGTVYVDTLYKNTAHDSIIWQKGGHRYAIRDSVGSGGSSSWGIDTLSVYIRGGLGLAMVGTLGSDPQMVIPARTHYVTTIIDVFASWTDGTVGYDGITSLYFFSNGCSNHQYQIDCGAGASISPYFQRGVPIQTALGLKDNVKDNAEIYVTTDFDSTVGDSNLRLFIYYKQTRVN